MDHAQRQTVTRRTLLRAVPGTASLMFASEAIDATPTNENIPSVSRAVALAGLPTVSALVQDLQDGAPALRPSLIAEHAITVRLLAEHLNERPGLKEVINQQLAGTAVAWNATVASDVQSAIASQGIQLPALAIEQMIQLGELSATRAPSFDTLILMLARSAHALRVAARTLEAQHLQGVAYWRYRTAANDEQKPINHQNLKDDATLLAASGTGLVAASIPAPGILTGMGASSALAAGVAGALFWTGVGAIIVVGGIAAYLVLSDIAGSESAPSTPPSPMRPL